MLSCKEISELVSRSMDRELPFWRRLGVWMHLRMCRFCTGFQQQLHLLREAARGNAEQIARGEDRSVPALSSDARERMRRALNKSGNE